MSKITLGVELELEVKVQIQESNLLHSKCNLFWIGKYTILKLSSTTFQVFFDDDFYLFFIDARVLLRLLESISM